MPETCSAPITAEWLIGFVEGDGCFTVNSKWNNTTRGGDRVYYRLEQPQFVITQKERFVLERISEFLDGLGVKGRIWNKKLKAWERWEYRTLGYKNCSILVGLFDGRLVSERYRSRFEVWKRLVEGVRRTGKPLDDSRLVHYPFPRKPKCHSFMERA